MKSMADLLPPEIARQIHPDWRKNEADYWAAREQLLTQHSGLWIAFADGAVIATGDRPVKVYEAAHLSGRHPFVTCVGREDQWPRMRRTQHAHDTNYSGEPLPVLQVEYRSVSGQAGLTLDRVIADTGADASALPWIDCQLLHLDPTQGSPNMMIGVAGGSAPTVIFSVWVYLDGQEHSCQLQVDYLGSERILGRDVLNSLDVLFRGPARELFINP